MNSNDFITNHIITQEKRKISLDNKKIYGIFTPDNKNSCQKIILYRMCARGAKTLRGGIFPPTLIT